MYTKHKDLGKEQLSKQNENAELIREIAELCNRPDRNDPEVVLLLGSIGVGKSAMVNTIIKAITGKHFHKAKFGRGNVASKTLALEWFENCGIERFELQGSQKEAFSNCLLKLPHIIDAPGMGDHHSAEVVELLEAVVGGFIPPGTSVKTLQKLQKDYGVGCLKKLYPNSRKELEVTRVVFVSSAAQSLPTALVEIVRNLLESHDHATGMYKYNIDPFVVITKCDLVEGFSTSGTISEYNMIKQDKFKQIQDEVAKEFSIDGAMEQNSIRWQSYVDGRCLDDPYIDNIALKFVRQMMLPRRRRHQVEADKMPVRIPRWMRLLKRMKELIIYIINMNGILRNALFVGVLFVLYIVYMLLTN